MEHSNPIRKVAAGIVAMAMLIGTLTGCSAGQTSSSAQSGANSSTSAANAAIKRGESHDPSIVKANGKYYIFGSHRAWLKSDDLISWTPFTNNLSTDYEKIFNDIWVGWAK